jgi:uncharacterized protein (DUF58 family)
VTPQVRAGGSASQGTPTWLLARPLTAVVVVALLIAAAGMLLSRPDLALLALPLIVAVAWSYDRRPDPAQQAVVEVDTAMRAGGDRVDWVLRSALPDRTETVRLRLGLVGGKPVDLVLGARSAREVTGRLPVLHSGPQELVRAEYQLAGVDGGFRSTPQGPVVAERVISPSYRAIVDLPLPWRRYGPPGAHDSARPGEGGEFRDVHLFTAGDRLRHIDWKATARRGRLAGDLFVRRTQGTSDATVYVVLDSRDDLGEQIAEWRSNVAASKGVSGLDVAREAASSIVAGYIGAGDRVGLHDLANPGRIIAPRGGGRHLAALLRGIELTCPPAHAQVRHRPPVVTPGALVYVLSSFVDEEAAQLALLLRHSGHRVIAVDVLPAARFERTSRYERAAHRIVVMERADRLEALRAQGVELLRWPHDGAPGSREVALRVLTRAERGPR